MSLSLELRQAIRGWRSSPGFTLVALATLAVGIGATTAIWSVVYGVLLRPLPFPEASRVVFIGHSYRKGEFEAGMSAASFKLVREQNRVLQNIAVATFWQPTLMLGDLPERLPGTLVSADWFRTLGIQPLVGRDFRAGEDQAGNDKVIILSEKLWTRAFGRERNVVGRVLQVDGEGMEIVGVMPEGLSTDGTAAEVFRPVVFSPAQANPDNWGWEWLAMVARMKPGVTPDAVTSDFSRLAAQVREERKNPYLEKWGYWWRSVPDQLQRGSKPALLVLLGAVGLVLLIACANLTNLLLVRAVARGREIAVRVALGARRRQLIRQLLTESVLLALVGGGLGLGLAWGGVKVMLGLLPGNLPYANHIGVNPAVLLATLVLSLTVGVVTGLAPMWFAFRADGNELLKEGARGATGWGRLRPTLAAAQLGLSMMLLVGAGMLGRTVTRLLAVDPGFKPDGVLTFQLALPRALYPNDTTKAEFLEILTARLRELPGVVAAGAAQGMPLANQSWTQSFNVDGFTPPTPDEGPWGDAALATAGYMEAMGMTLVEGRFFGSEDRADSRRVAVVDEVLAKRYWKGQSAVGRYIDWNGPHTEVIGVVRHVVRQGPVDPGRTQVYGLFTQSPDGLMGVAIRTKGDPTALTGPAREALRGINAQLAMFDVRTMKDRMGDLAAQPRFLALLIACFAAIALLLAGIGIYGVLAYAVAQRTREMGIRMALGADRSRVVRLVLGDGLKLGGFGLAFGVVGALAGTRLLTSQLYGAPAVQPLIFGAALGACALALLLASWLPAWRATGVDPVEALRSE